MISREVATYTVYNMVACSVLTMPFEYHLSSHAMEVQLNHYFIPAVVGVDDTLFLKL